MAGIIYLEKIKITISTLLLVVSSQVKSITAGWLNHAKLITSECSNIMKFLKNNNTFIMKILITVILLPFLLISVGNANEWRLVWSDEFNYKGRLDSDKWVYDVGLGRNDEIGYFTDRLKNVRVEGGVLVIEAHKETYTNEGEVASYTTGSITTKGRESFKYGRFEVRAKMPYGHGSHIAAWFSGLNYGEVGWPACGEIDLMEYVGRLPHTIHLYNHYANPSDITQDARTVVGKFTVMNPYYDFHIYAMEWDETQIKYFIDNKQVATFNLDIAGTGPANPFRKEQVFYLTYALGAWGWDVDDSMLPQKFEVDYIRVYKAATTTAPVYLLLSN